MAFIPLVFLFQYVLSVPAGCLMLTRSKMTSKYIQLAPINWSNKSKSMYFQPVGKSMLFRESPFALFAERACELLHMYS